MRAIVYTRPGDTDVLELVDRPIPDEHPVTRVCLRAQFMIPPYLGRRPAVRLVIP